MNARSPFVVGQKQAVTRANLNDIQRCFVETERYLRGLVNTSGQLIESRLRTFVVGFISGMKAVIGLANDVFNDYADVWYIAELTAALRAAQLAPMHLLICIDNSAVYYSTARSKRAHNLLIQLTIRLYHVKTFRAHGGAQQG